MLLLSVLTISLFASSSFVDCYIFQPGPYFPPTRGEVWPKAQEENKTVEFFTVPAGSFKFKADTIGCQEFLKDSLTRYSNMLKTQSYKAVKYVISKMFHGSFPSRGKYWLNDTNYRGDLLSLDVELSTPCPGDDVVPDKNMNEAYELTISVKERKLISSSIWGILRGLETFSQLVYRQEDQLFINATTIRDFPRFPHRGLMIDTSRHFEPVSILLQALDGMSYNKLNVFHWHITDDFSFPYQSSVFPELTKGAYDPTLVYSKSDVQNIIEYARRRGIRVIPEFDTPGHTRAWGVSHPELLVPCYGITSLPAGSLGPSLGPMDPTKNSTYSFLAKLFKEIKEVFPDSYLHIGGDEVDFLCWQSNPDIRAYVAANNLTNYQELQAYFVKNVINITAGLPLDTIVWEDVFTDGVETPDSTLIQVWQGNATVNSLDAVTAAGKTALFSSCYYLDQLANGGDWSKFYGCDPFAFNPDDKQKKLIIGGEGCMWGEFVNEHSILQRIFPRVSAVAEKLWSAQSATVLWVLAANRMEEHGCRMNNRGLPSQAPTAPGYCV